MSFIEKRFRADQFTNKILERNGKLGRDACEIMATSINAVDAYRCVLDQICIKDQNLQIGTQYFNL
ncbi:MAG: hypothetical protein ACK2TV_06090, partial [Anaerolineales bacterium]